MIFLLLIHLIYLYGYVINRCQSCCKVQILSLYNPLSSNHKYNFNNDSEIYWVMDFQFDNEFQYAQLVKVDNTKKLLRK